MIISYFKKPYRDLRNFLLALKSEYKFNVPGHNAKVLLSGRDFIYDRNPFQEIFHEGIYSTSYKDAVTLDIGAHKGYFTIYALLNGASRVYSYEPDEFNFKFLEKNVKLNSFLDRAVLFNQAVGGETSERDFFLMRSSASHSLVRRHDRELVGRRKVTAVSINDVLANIEKEGKKIIVKLDIEGGEYEILPAIKNEYFSMMDKFFIEYHDVPGCSQKAMNDYILSKSFRIERKISDREYLFVNN